MIYDIERLMRVVDEAFEAENDYQKYCREIRNKECLLSDGTIWVPSLDGNKAYRLGELCERSTQKWTEIADICNILDIDQKLLIAVTKSIRRLERNHWKHEHLLSIEKDNYDGIRMMQYLQNRNDGQFYKSTGRRKAWCEEKK